MTFSMVGALEAVLYDVDLSVTGTILKGAYLSGAIIRHAQRFSANLAWADCSYADFRGTHMRYVNAGNTSFWHANDPILSYSNLDLANFQGVDLHKTNICREGNLIWNTTMPDGTIQVGPQYGDRK